MSTNRLVTILASVGVVVVVFVCLPLMSTTMRAPGVNCGTVFASSDSWTYKSSFDAGNSSYYAGARTNSDLEAGALAAVEDLMADLDRGSSAYSFCESRHSDRRALLISFGVAGLVFLGVAVWCEYQERRRFTGSPRAGDDASSVR